MQGKVIPYFVHPHLKVFLMTHLNLSALRLANQKRLPLFKNNLLAPAHSQPDGSDWSPMMWMIALMGEVGETADEIYNGGTTEKKAAELADIQIYLDILAQRITDKDTSGNCSPNYTEVHLCELIRRVGALCELHKKYVRGDIGESSYIENRREQMLRAYEAMGAIGKGSNRYVNVVETGEGVDLAAAVISKFNRTSDKVKAPVYLAPNSVVWDGDETVLPMLRNSDEIVDNATGLKELPPIRLTTNGYNQLVAVAQAKGLVIQEVVRQALVKEVESFTGKAAPKERQGWATGRDSSHIIGSVVTYSPNTEASPPPYKTWLKCKWNHVDTESTWLWFTEQHWWVDESYRVYHPPVLWRHIAPGEVMPNSLSV